MRILIAHSAYQLRGGEDMVVDSEIALLRSNGHEVAEYRRDNSDIAGMSKIGLAANTLWSQRTVHDLDRLIAEFKPDVIHAHNTLPLISPSLYWAAERAGVPVVQTLHNFRQMCLSAMFLRDGKVCEDCLGHLPWRGVTRKCYRGSAIQSAVMAGMLVLHRGLGTYTHKVARFIALNDFSRGKFIEGGLPAGRIVVKPNFVDIPAGSNGVRKGALYVGRLSAEKGIDVLVRAMCHLPACQLHVIGSGPEEPVLYLCENINKLGFMQREQIVSHMQSASYLLLPSICYENFPLTLVEAFACGLPVIASRIGAMAVLIEDGKTGLLFEPGSAKDLAKKIEWAETHPEIMLEMGKNARKEYEEKYTPEHNIRQLIHIYNGVIGTRT